jgi:hypothetical protein
MRASTCTEGERLSTKGQARAVGFGGLGCAESENEGPATRSSSFNFADELRRIAPVAKK